MSHGHPYNHFQIQLLDAELSYLQYIEYYSINQENRILNEQRNRNHTEFLFYRTFLRSFSFSLFQFFNPSTFDTCVYLSLCSHCKIYSTYQYTYSVWQGNYAHGSMRKYTYVFFILSISLCFTVNLSTTVVARALYTIENLLFVRCTFFLLFCFFFSFVFNCFCFLFYIYVEQKFFFVWTSVAGKPSSRLHR